MVHSVRAVLAAGPSRTGPLSARVADTAAIRAYRIGTSPSMRALYAFPNKKDGVRRARPRVHMYLSDEKTLC